MRIKNKYIRNRHFRLKNWKRIRNTEHPYETTMPWFYYNKFSNYLTEKQIEDNFDWITKRARALEKGAKRGMWLMNVPSSYRRELNKIKKARERNILAKINRGNYELEFPIFKKDAHYLFW